MLISWREWRTKIALEYFLNPTYTYIGNKSRVHKGCGPDKPCLVLPDLSLVGQKVVDSFTVDYSKYIPLYFLNEEEESILSQCILHVYR
jgi:hypothetical protein